jgi:hypothetical protein
MKQKESGVEWAKPAAKFAFDRYFGFDLQTTCAETSVACTTAISRKSRPNRSAPVMTRFCSPQTKIMQDTDRFVATACAREVALSVAHLPEGPNRCSYMGQPQRRPKAIVRSARAGAYHSQSPYTLLHAPKYADPSLPSCVDFSRPERPRAARSCGFIMKEATA